MHPMEEDVTLPDGRTVRVVGGFAVAWRKVQGTDQEDEWLQALNDWYNEYHSKL